MQGYLKSGPIEQPAYDNQAVIEWGLKHMVLSIWHNVVPLIKANLCFLLFLIPIITIPAAFYAMSEICIELIRGKQTSVFRTFGDAVKKEFLFSAKLFCSLGIVFALALFGAMFYLQQAEQMKFLSVFSFILVVVAVITYLMIPYCFSMAAITPLPYKKVIKNAFLVAFLNLRYSLMGGIIGLALFLIQYLLLIRLFPLTLSVGLSLVFFVEIYCALYGVQRFVLTEKL